MPWYSKYSKYSPPQIKYKPAVYTETLAQCDLIPALGEVATGVLNLLQIKGAPIRIFGDIDGLRTETTYDLTVGELGVCSNPGEEFNPLKELDSKGNLNIWQDPTRGRIDSVTSDEKGEARIVQRDFLQNLGGKDSLIGRSISLAVQGETSAVACCVIGLAGVEETEEVDPLTSKIQDHGPYRGVHYHPNGVLSRKPAGRMEYIPEHPKPAPTKKELYAEPWQEPYNPKKDYYYQPKHAHPHPHYPASHH